MTETPTHTPLPWAFEAGVEDNEGEFYVCHAGTVCTETTVCNPHSEADARLIVQAVNSHHRLVEALEAALGWIDALPDEVVAKLPAMPGFDRDDVEELLAALKETRHG